MHRKIINQCEKISAREDLKVRQNYRRTIKKLAVDQLFRNHPKNKGKVRKADKKLKTIAGRLVREIERQLPSNAPHWNAIGIFNRVLSQTRTDKNKIYSLHKPEVECIAKGKEHKKYEFGNKVSITRMGTGVIVGAKSFRNEYDGHTLEPVLQQVSDLVGQSPKTNTCDRGYRGKTQIEETIMQIPKPFSNKKLSKYKQDKLRKAYKKRAGIEALIGHLKSDHRLSRNFYKGIVGDNINVMLAASAFNFKRMLNKWKHSFCSIFKIPNFSLKIESPFFSFYFNLKKMSC